MHRSCCKPTWLTVAWWRLRLTPPAPRMRPWPWFCATRACRSRSATSWLSTAKASVRRRQAAPGFVSGSHSCTRAGAQTGPPLHRGLIRDACIRHGGGRRRAALCGARPSGTPTDFEPRPRHGGRAGARGRSGVSRRTRGQRARAGSSGPAVHPVDAGDSQGVCAAHATDRHGRRRSNGCTNPSFPRGTVPLHAA